MDVQKQAIEYLNPGQIPVTIFDQPLFALAKFVQWKWPDTYGEQKYVVMFGGLHIEMALWNTLGDVLENSGWTAALTEAEVASSGTASSFLKVAHLAKTRHAHQITLLALKKLQHNGSHFTIVRVCNYFSEGSSASINYYVIVDHYAKICTFSHFVTIISLSHLTTNCL